MEKIIFSKKPTNQKTEQNKNKQKEEEEEK